MIAKAVPKPIVASIPLTSSQGCDVFGILVAGALDGVVAVVVTISDGLSSVLEDLAISCRRAWNMTGASIRRFDWELMRVEGSCFFSSVNALSSLSFNREIWQRTLGWTKNQQA